MPGRVPADGSTDTSNARPRTAGRTTSGPEPQPRSLRRVVVVGLGNPILGDDGVGWRVADQVEARLSAGGANGAAIGDGPGQSVDVVCVGVGGLRLMELLTGYDSAILVDAAEFAGRPEGEVRVCPFDELEAGAAGHLDSAHDASLRTALDLGRGLGADLPRRIETVTIQARRTDVFSEELSPAVAAAVPRAVEAVLRLLEAW